MVKGKRPLTEAQKLEERRENRRFASRRYRERQKVTYNEQSRARMARNRAALTEHDKEMARERRAASSSAYYQRNRESILEKANRNHVKKYLEEKGEDYYWANYKPRERRAPLGRESTDIVN